MGLRARSSPGPCPICGTAHSACRGSTPDSLQVVALAGRVLVGIVRRGGVMTHDGSGPTTYGVEVPEVPDPSPPPVPVPPEDVPPPAVEDTPAPEHAPTKKRRPSGIPGGAKKK